MTIEGLGKKFQEARLARSLTLDEAARMTKIRPARLAEIEADDFSQFPSLAYAKGFLLIYGKFLDVDVTPYLDAFEDSERVTVDGYSYLQENRPHKPVTAPVVRRRRPTSSHDRVSPMPLIFGVLVLVIGFSVMKLVLNVQRLAPGKGESTAQASPSASLIPSPKAGQSGTTETSPSTVASAPTVAPSASPAPKKRNGQFE
jgi:cytoskeletal protein RodZ